MHVQATMLLNAPMSIEDSVGTPGAKNTRVLSLKPRVVGYKSPGSTELIEDPDHATFERHSD